MAPPKAQPRAKKAGTSKEAAAARKARFVEAYIANGHNATEAAITAGYSTATARQAGSRLLSDAHIGAAIAKRTQALADKYELKTERTLREVARLAYSDLRNLYNADGSLKSIHELDDDTAATIASVELEEIKENGVVIGLTRKVKQWDKRAALDMAMKYHGAYEKDNNQAREKVKIIVMPGGKDPELQ